MHEHVARALYYLDVHLLYASIVWFAAWVLTSIRGGSATTKYWIWVATALNFSLPLGAALDKVWAAHLSWATPLSVVGVVADGISRNAAAVAVLCAVWLLGAISMFDAALPAAAGRPSRCAGRRGRSRRSCSGAEPAGSRHPGEVRRQPARSGGRRRSASSHLAAQRHRPVAERA